MLAVLGILPMDDIEVEKKTTDTFPAEINYILLNDTIRNNDSLVLQFPNIHNPDSTRLHIVTLKNLKPSTIIKVSDSLLTCAEVEYFVQVDPNFSE